MIIVYFNEESFEFFSTLTKLEEELAMYGFIRIHRSYLVAKAYIKSFSYQEVVLMNDIKLPVSRGRYQAMKEAMDY